MTYTTGDILLNKYRIERLLGNGAYAEVYLATHIETMGLRALKVLRKDIPGVSEREYIEAQSNFLQEAQLGEKFIHPNLVRVYDYGQESGNQITVLEYCSGGSLAGRLHPPQGTVGDLKLGQVIQMGMDVARGLSVLHGRDVIHRDIKPGNILFDEQGVAKVSDLGLAQTPEEDYMRAGQGSVAPDHPGTFAYMPPEQRPGHKMPVKASADVYALGCVLYESLTGRMYYHKKPQTKLLDIRADVPSWLDELLVRMLMDDPKARPWDGSEVLGLLEQGVQEEVRQKRAAQEQANREIEAQSEEHENCKKQEYQRRFVTQGQRIVQPGSRASNQPSAKDPLVRKRSSVAWMWVALSGMVIIAMVTIALMKFFTPEASNNVQVSTKVMASPTAVIMPTTATWTMTPMRDIADMVTNATPLVTVTTEPSPTPLVYRLKYGDTCDAIAYHFGVSTQSIMLINDLPADYCDRLKADDELLIPFPTLTLSPQPTSNEKSLALPTVSKLGDSMLSSVDGMELVYIPAGEFQMGCDPAHNGGYECGSDTLQLHTVYLDAYYIDKTEVTNAQYAMCVAAGACDVPRHLSSYTNSSYYNDASFANHPVIYIYWQDASKYCEWANRKLPTEAQWEKAARGENLRAYPWGDEKPSCELVNGVVDGNMCVGDTTAVGSYPSGESPYGVLDMAGNVSEWVSDWYSSIYYGSLSNFINPTGPAAGTQKVVRGGCFRSNVMDDYLRISYRLSSDPSYWHGEVGFRCAIPPAP